MIESPASEPIPRRRRGSWLQWYGQQPKNTGAFTSHQDGGISSPPPERRHTFSVCDTSVNTPRPVSRGSSRPSTPRGISSAAFSLFSSFQTSPHFPSCVQADQNSDDHASQFSTSPNPLPNPAKPELSSRPAGSFGKMAFNSMLGGLSALSLSRTSATDDKDKESRGRSSNKSKPRSSSFVYPSNGKEKDGASTMSKDSHRARSQSPFSLRRWRSRDRESSPTPLPLEESDCESFISKRSPAVRPRTAFTDDPDSGSEYAGEETEDEEDDWSDDMIGIYDTLTERNTEQNASLMSEIDADADAAFDPDPHGEGVNVIIPPEPYFPSTLNRTNFSSSRGKRGAPKRKKSRPHELLPLSTSRPLFQRDRCTITIVQGDPVASERRKKTYVVASDLSEESRYAVEWGIGTVLRDGDEMLIVTVVENENKVDPILPNSTDRATKLRSQQERQGLAYILVRQATSLLQRTRLNVTVSCQAWHAKNARHMLLDVVDYNEPTMLIVGSRGLGQLRGILLGSTSHYLIQRCSVPVMVTRRRLKRPPRRSAHLAKHRARVSLAEAAGIDRVAAKVDQDVAVLRDAMQREDERRGDKPPIPEAGEVEDTAEGEGDGAEGEGYLGVKVRG
ncbi:hypothetical protein M404DRAFT_1005869 [Pisolithus tinctorius Marx 270]|uniref:UspA domain-containing protein n=1 Tax=Pisolithus tinctorius Marx 270 TaxID=870435 RepID=A0A0C3IL43_PISTI|nr:hypothetical protein M404DRAFT_1005869 [Pisolithus tinctorius Marx 270]